MSDSSAQEPTMEEILASIRRIISEDDTPAAASAEPEHAADAPPAGGGDDILELTDRFEEPEPVKAPEPQAEPAPRVTESIGDIDAFAPRAPEPRAPEPRIASRVPEPQPSWSTAGAEVDEDEPLVSSHRADAAAGHFGALANSIAMPPGGRSLEDVVRELLRPLLKDWLDKNLHQIVEDRVQAEVERIARRRVY